MATTTFGKAWRRGDVVNYAGELVCEFCCECGMPFGLSREFYDRACNDPGLWWWCPAGHRQHYVESDLDREKRARANAEEQARIEAAARQKVERDLRRLQARYRNGVCPCCHRSFEQLARHIATRHPGFAVGHDHDDGYVSPRDEFGRVQCAGCEKWVSLRKDGTLRAHKARRWDDEHCGGSGEQPL